MRTAFRISERYPIEELYTGDPIWKNVTIFIKGHQGNIKIKE